MEQFDQVRVIQAIRDRFIHGYQLPNLEEPTKQLQVLVNELISMWQLSIYADRFSNTCMVIGLSLVCEGLTQKLSSRKT
jgi:hypothetical protein